MPRSGTWSKLWLAAAVMFAGVLRAAPAQAQGATITGKVESDLAQPLEAANVFITELNLSVGTNAQGRFTITVPAARVSGQQVVLRVRAIGYLAAATPITLTNGTITHDFSLKRDVNRLDEVVVTGMSVGTEQKKTPFTISAVTTQDMPVPEVSALSSLEGKVPGAQIVTPTGRPGQSAVAVLRGPHSIDGGNVSQSPLIIVDGVMLAPQLTGGTSGVAGTGAPSTADINDEDIESIEIVKGAAASSLYGSRAGNGVISITTKNAKNAAPGIKFTLRSELGMQDVQHEYPTAQNNMLQWNETNTRVCVTVSGQPDCSRTVNLYTEALRVNDQGGVYSLTPYPFLHDFGISNTAPKNVLQGDFQSNTWPTTFDPVREALTNGLINTNTVDATGKFGSTGFYTSFSNLIQNGTARYELGYRRQSARLNLDGQPGGAFSTQVQTYYARTTNYPDNLNWFGLTRQHPYANVLARDTKGRLYVLADVTNEGATQNYNPMIDAACCYGRTDGERFLGTVNSKYTATNWLDFDGSASIDRSRSSEADLQDIGYRTRVASTTAGPLTAGNGGNTGGIFNEDLTGASYNAALDGIARHNFGSDLATRFTARYTYDQQDASTFRASGRNLTVPGLLSIANAQVQNTPSTNYSSIRAMGFSGNENVSYKDRYILDALFRRDGSSLFGSANRWDNYGRASLAYRISDESWWMFPKLFDDFKLRASVGSAGGRPQFVAQYETFNVGTGGSITATALGNKQLKPEYTLETEYGADAEILNKYGLTFNYARDITRNQILAVPPSVSSGFSSQYKNAGTMDGKTYEVSLRMPLYTGKSAVLSGTLNWDANRAKITAMDIPPYTSSIGGATFEYAPGERYGNIYGKRFITSCADLDPTDGFNALCGAAGSNMPWQMNDGGYVVWVGCKTGAINGAQGTFANGHMTVTQKASLGTCQANNVADGITHNLWQLSTAGCQVGTPAAPNAGITGATNCFAAGGAVTTPYGQPRDYWGMLTDLRDSTANPLTVGPCPTTAPANHVNSVGTVFQCGQTLLGNSLPLWRMTFSPNFQYKKLNIYAIFDHSHGNKVYNQDFNWSLGDFLTNFEDQTGNNVATAKPLGYYWRAPAPDHPAGVGGFYDVLGSNNLTVENATYTKLREVSVSWQIGHVPNVMGDWTVSAITRNIMTISGYRGWDPEVGLGGGGNGSAAITAVQSSNTGNGYPATRTFTIALQSRF